MAADSLTTPVPTTPAPQTRNPWLDNAKMTLVLLVVVGHSWTLLPSGVVRDHLYDFLYLWHVPAFVLVTGYLSRSFAWTPPRLWQLVRTVAIPYVLFEAAMALFRLYVGGERLHDVFRDPHWPMWYLAALFVWRLVTPVLTALPAAGALVAAFAVSLAGGFWADSTLDLYRICGLLPFFALGLVATPDRLERLRTPAARRTALAAGGVLVGATVLVERLASTDWLYYSYGYQSLGASGLHALVLRAALLVAGTVGALAFLALVPRTSGWFTRMGAATLVVYLCHGFVVKSVEYAGFPAWAAGHATLALVLATLGAAGLALVLACPPVAGRLTDLVDPFGYAERHVRRGLELTDASAEADGISDALEAATARH